MKIKINNSNVDSIKYNNKNVDRVFYNGEEILSENNYYRFKNDKSKIGQTELKFTCGLGEAKVNVFTGRLIISHEGMIIGEGNFKFGISHVFNSHLLKTNTSICGIGWKLNLQQYCYPYDENDDESEQGFKTGDYIYIDGEGYKHRFIKYKEETNSVHYYDDSGSGLRLKIEGTNKFISNSKGDTLQFNSNNNLVAMVSGKNAGIRKVTLYSDGRPNVTRDNRKISRYFQYNYDDEGLLINIKCYENNSIIKTLFYEYNENSLLTSISQISNNQTKKISSFIYDENKNLSYFIDEETKKCLFFEYSFQGNNSQVTKVTAGIATISSDGVVLSANNVLSNSVFNYINSQETLVTNEKNISYLYQFNTKGFTASIFEKTGENELKTLTKSSGWSLFDSGPGTTSINGYNSENICGNNACFWVSSSKIGEFVGIFDNYSNGEPSNYRFFDEFVVSFWIKLNRTDKKDIIAKLRLFFGNYYEEPEYKVSIDKTAYNIWQYVTIPISFNNSINKRNNLIAMKITLENLSNVDFEISDIRIAVDNNPKLMIDDKDFLKAEKLECWFENGEYLIKEISSELFMSENDVINTYKSMYENKVKKGLNSFDWIYCNGTKVTQVKGVAFLSYNSEEGYNDFFGFLINEDKTANMYYKNANRVDDNKWIISETKLRFEDAYFEQISICDKLNSYNDRVSENAKSKIVCAYYYNGLIKSEKDSYGIINNYVYDSYFNLERVEVYNENDVSKKLCKSFTYPVTSVALREVAREINDNNIITSNTYLSPFFNLYESTMKIGGSTTVIDRYTYDNHNERITDLLFYKSNLQVDKHSFTYYENGLMESVENNSNLGYYFEYDIYGNISAISSINTNNTKDLLLLKTYQYNYSDNHYTCVSEQYYNGNKLATRTNLIDKYGRLILKEESGINTNYTYQNISESASLAQISKINDNYDNQTYHFNYDLDNRMYGYVASGSSLTDNTSLTIRQIGENKTRYIIQRANSPVETLHSEIIYENEEADDDNYIYLNPRIKRTKNYHDQYSENTFNYTYSYDGFNRLVKISNTEKDLTETIDCDIEDNLTYSYNDSNLISSESRYIRKILNPNDNYYDVRYDAQYLYDEVGNLKNITEEHKTSWVYIFTSVETIKLQKTCNVSYSYDICNRLTSETNSLLNLNRNFVYEGNKLISTYNESKQEKAFTYNNKGQLVNYISYKNEVANENVTYNYDKFGNVSQIINNINNQGINLIYERGNLLKNYGNYEYKYNHQGIRFRKNINGLIKNYFYEGKKLLKEVSSNYDDIYYFYNAKGIAGFSYDGEIYVYVLDVLGNVRKILKQNHLVTEYDYDSFGNCKITNYKLENDTYVIDNSINHIGNINPIRWKSYYYDIETGLYYIDGRYYDSRLGLYLNADNIERVMDNVYLMNGLDRHAVTLDNLISKEANDITVFTYNNYSVDPSYYPNEDKSWWDLHWKEAVKWITAGILFVVGIILAIIPCTSCIGITMLKTGFSYGISGLLMGGIISGIVAAIQGNDILNAISDGLINGFIDGFILGSITGLITGSIGLASNCFKIGTLVLCEEGYKRIEDIKVGDKVYAYDEKTKDKALKKVVRLFKNKTKKWIHIFVDKEEIICTGEHPFYIKGRGFVKAESIFEKEEVILYNGNTSIISKIEIEYLEKEEETYNFEVEDYHTYYVSEYGVLVHNWCVDDEFDVMADSDYYVKYKELGVENKAYHQISGKHKGNFIAKDKTRHGHIKESRFKLFKQNRKKLKLIGDLDAHGNIMLNKHSSNIGNIYEIYGRRLL